MLLRISVSPGNSRILFLIVPVLLFSWGCRSQLEPPDGPPDASQTTLSPTRGYILISIDTLRADHLGCYGYPKETSPFLDSLSEEALLFENAIVQLPGTLPSHMSIFTGLYPSEHGIHPHNKKNVLSKEIETLPEIFQRNGYRTAGHTEGGYVKGDYGFDRGFDEFDDSAEGIPGDIEDTFQRGVTFLRALEADEPFFLFLHTYEVHNPYLPPEPYNCAFWEGPPPPGYPVKKDEFPSPEVVAYLLSQYDGGILYTDEVLKGFFEELDALGLLSDTTIIITSDHGEEFMEHGMLYHVQVYSPTIKVPLILVHPDISDGIRVKSVVESIDFAPTLLHIAGLGFDGNVSGKSLLGYIDVEEQQRVTEGYSENWNGRSRSIYRRDGKGLHHVVLTQGRVFRKIEAFEVDAPSDSVDKQRAKRLADRLASYRREVVAEPDIGSYSSQHMERLKGLGYLQDK